MSELVFLTDGKHPEPYTTTAVMAECTGIAHRKLNDAIKKHEDAFRSFGLLASYQAESPSPIGHEKSRPFRIGSLFSLIHHRLGITFIDLACQYERRAVGFDHLECNLRLTAADSFVRAHTKLTL